MEIDKKNYVNTTGVISVPSDTATAKNLFRRDKSFQWASTGFNDDNTIASVTINLPETLTVSRIALIGHNLKAYNVFYDGVTANAFSMSTTSSTITSQFSTNSESSQFFTTTPVNCTSVTFDFKSTQVSNVEKAIGYLMVSDVFVNFERVPSSKNYKPEIETKDIVHKLSDGGVRIQFMDKKFRTDVRYKHISTSFRDSLKTAFDLSDDFIFTAFPTATSWDEILYPVVWDGDFEFFRLSDDAVNAGYQGRIRLRETST